MFLSAIRDELRKRVLGYEPMMTAPASQAA
jgi:hypothetical protein